jgi:hypothetical protein
LEVLGSRTFGWGCVGAGVYARSSAVKSLFPQAEAPFSLSRWCWDVVGALGRAWGSTGKRGRPDAEAPARNSARWRWRVPVAGALGPARLCSQPPLHMQRGSPSARGGSSAESGKPARGGAERAREGLVSPRCCGDGFGMAIPLPLYTGSPPLRLSFAG